MPTVILVAVLGAVLVGCGSNDRGGSSELGPSLVELPEVQVRSDVLIGRAVLEATEEGSPEEALYRWWRAVQFGEPEIEEHYARGVELDPLGRQLEVVGVTTQRPLVLDVEISEGEDEARVYGAVERFEFEGGDGEKVAEMPVIFNLKREAGEWKLGDNRFLEERLRARRRAE